MTAIINTTAAKTAELVAFWNAHCATVALNPVKKFTDRATAEARVISLIEKLALAEDAAEEAAEEAAAEEATNEAELATDEVVEEEAEETPNTGAFGALCGSIAAAASGESKPQPIPARARASNSEGIAASWARPEVAAARLTRHGVEVKVDGVVEEFKSTAAAFREHRLPMNKHIRFRLTLKEAGEAVFEHNGKKYAFTLVETFEE